MKKIYVALLLVAILILSGCGNKITGKVFADLQKDAINNGETTIIEVDGENTGNVPADVILKIIPEDESKLVISYPGSLEDTIQPSETIGTKRINVQGFTDHTSTKYWIKAQLINKADNKVLDEKIIWITVRK